MSGIKNRSRRRGERGGWGDRAREKSKKRLDDEQVVQEGSLEPGEDRQTEPGKLGPESPGHPTKPLGGHRESQAVPGL